jgi:hypothetical protein
MDPTVATSRSSPGFLNGDHDVLSFAVSEVELAGGVGCGVVSVLDVRARVA